MLRVLVYPHLMEIGGSQLNAIELARTVSEMGHSVIVFGPNGDLVPLVEKWDLEYVQAPAENAWPSIANMRALRKIVLDRHIDVAHGYEWGPALELAFGPGARGVSRRAGGRPVPLTVTVQSMEVPEFLPRHLPMIVGTAELADRGRTDRDSVYLMEPPIDTRANTPEAGSPTAARQTWQFEPHDIVISVICRLTTDLGKLDGVLQAIDVVDHLSTSAPVRLLVAGTGDALPLVRERAQAVNISHAREVVTVTGALLDPLPAYLASDIVLGMGSSALKGMAFGKPLIVQGEKGFWRLVDESSVAEFLYSGWWGSGGQGADMLKAAISPLICSAGLRAHLGEMGLKLVRDRFSLVKAGAELETIYELAIAQPVRAANRYTSLARSSAQFSKFKMRSAVTGALNGRWLRDEY